MRRVFPIATVVGLLTFSANPALPQQAAPPAPDLSPQDAAALSQLHARPAWLFPATDCPADVMPDFDASTHYVEGQCTRDVAGCADRCAAGDAGDCYALASALEATETDEPVFEALYLRACRLGIVSGCTNRAAGMTYRGPQGGASDLCAARSFARTCGRDDAWGCTMYGFHLMRGRGVPQDLDKAASMFRRACGYDETFIACTRAKKLLKEIEGQKDSPPASPD